VATQTATAVVQTYTVQRGDNWFSIARRFGTTQEALAAYNGRSPNDILQVNQKLRIPPAGVAVARPTPTPEPTKPARPSPTPTTEPTLAPEPPAVVKLPAPVLLAPGNDDGFNADTLPVLAWQPVPGVNAGDYYYVVVRFTLKNGDMGFAIGETTDASFTVPRWVFDQAQTPDRIGRWSVQVRRLGPAGDAIEVSPPSETRSFYWR
jgi:LysM repeat protein